VRKNKTLNRKNKKKRSFQFLFNVARNGVEQTQKLLKSYLKEKSVCNYESEELLLFYKQAQ